MCIKIHAFACECRSGVRKGAYEPGNHNVASEGETSEREQRETFTVYRLSFVLCAGLFQKKFFKKCAKGKRKKMLKNLGKGQKKKKKP